MRRCPQGHEVPDTSFKFCPTCGEEIHEVESAQAFGPPLRLTEDASPASAPPEPERSTAATEEGPNLAAEIAALRRANEEREARSSKTRQWILLGFLLLVLALVGLWSTGRMDTTLAGIGLNKNDCITNAFGATFCGDDAKRYQAQVKAALSDAAGAASTSDDASKAANDVRAAIPSAEAYYSDCNTYATVTVACEDGLVHTFNVAGLQTYDSELQLDVAIGSANHYCLSIQVNNEIAKVVGPGGTVQHNVAAECTSAAG